MTDITDRQKLSYIAAQAADARVNLEIVAVRSAGASLAGCGAKAVNHGSEQEYPNSNRPASKQPPLVDP